MSTPRPFYQSKRQIEIQKPQNRRLIVKRGKISFWREMELQTPWGVASEMHWCIAVVLLGCDVFNMQSWLWAFKPDSVIAGSQLFWCLDHETQQKNTARQLMKNVIHRLQSGKKVSKPITLKANHIRLKFNEPSLIFLSTLQNPRGTWAFSIAHLSWYALV